MVLSVEWARISQASPLPRDEALIFPVNNWTEVTDEWDVLGEEYRYYRFKVCYVDGTSNSIAGSLIRA